MFPGAHDFVIGSSQFNIYNSGPSGIDILFEASELDAAIDAEARQYAPSCFPGTREQYIDDITDWATTGNDDQGLPIYWMTGPAGVGKSAIAQTCAEKVKDAGHLGAAFFFSVNGRSDHRRFFTTLAYQLSTVLPDYRQVVDGAIQNDKSLVTKALQSQFNGLVVEPLRKLAEQGKEVRRRTIFIDGLDECSSTDAQSKIIEIIAASVRDRTTPFYWAVFSRPEAHIVSTFERHDISPQTRSVLLPVSRECDGEIEIYLRSGFENMLRRRNLPLSPSWPADEVIERLLDASAGLFAYPAAVLRFIDHHSYSGFEERLEAVLNAILQPNSQHPHSPFAELDAFYLLIMKRISHDLLPSVLLLFGEMTESDKFTGLSWSVSLACNVLGFSVTEFRCLLNALQAVLTFQGPPEPPILDQNIDLTRSYFDQDQPSSITSSLSDWFLRAHGTVNFYHKSFYDFLVDPTRSSTFCVTTQTVREKLFHYLVQRHFHFARSFVIQGPSLVLPQGIPNSSASLSWPNGAEFVDSFLKLQSFCTLSCEFSHDSDNLARFMKDMPQNLLQKLAELDYHKFLASNLSLLGHGLLASGWVVGYEVGELRLIPGTEYRRVVPYNFSALDLVAFLRVFSLNLSAKEDPDHFLINLQMVMKLEELEVIKPYHRHLPSSFASAYQSFSQQLKPFGKRSRLYKLGRGEKSIIWYWEFDTKRQYFHEFQTLDYLDAKRIYDTEKFKMWERDWEMPSLA